MAAAFIESDIVSATGPSTNMPDATVTGAGGANDALLIGAGWLDGTQAVTATGRVGASPTGVTQHGSTFSVSGGAFRMALFIKKNPGSGSLVADVELSSACENLFVAAALYSGVDQTTPLGTLRTGSANNDTPTLSPVGFVTDAMIAAFTQSFRQTLTVTAGTEREQTWNVGVEKTACWSDRATDGALSWSQTSHIWGMIGVVLLPAAGGGGSSILRQMMQHHRGRNKSMVGWRRHESGLYLKAA